jgi:hypothetical protein
VIKNREQKIREPSEGVTSTHQNKYSQLPVHQSGAGPRVLNRSGEERRYAEFPLQALPPSSAGGPEWPLALGGSSPWARATGNLITRDGPESSGSAEAVEVPASDSAHGVRDPFQVCRATVSSATMVGGESRELMFDEARQADLRTGESPTYRIQNLSHRRPYRGGRRGAEDEGSQGGLSLSDVNEHVDGCRSESELISPYGGTCLSKSDTNPRSFSAQFP